MKEHVVLIAPEISHFMNVFDDRSYSREYGRTIREYMKKIREAVKIFEQGDNEHVHLWFSAPRGNIEDWEDYEDLRQWNEDPDGKYKYTREDYQQE